MGLIGFRRRRRRSSFAKPHPKRDLALIGVGVVLAISGFVYLIHQSDVLAPAPQQIQVELPDAFKQ